MALCLSLYCEVDIMVALCLTSKCRGYVVFERGVVYSRYCIAPNPQWRFPVWESCVDEVSGLEILLCEGGDVELCARTSKHILVFAFDPLSLTLSLLLCALH